MNMQRLKKNKSGFTLLEIIIVIIIVGVLASLALPKLFSTIEFSRSTEALASLGMIRKSMERCYLMNNQSYATNCAGWSNIDIDNPAGAAGAHFGYGISGTSVAGFTLTATRNTADGGDGTSTITLIQDNSAGTVSRAGSAGGVFESIK